MTKVYSVAIENSKNRNKSSKKVLKGFIFLTFLIVLSGYCIFQLLSNPESLSLGSLLEPIAATIEETIEPELEQDNDLTNILIVGVDTRATNPGLSNTDTIIVLTVDHNHETAVMTSIPRDLWLKYKLPNGNDMSSKVNSAYANGEYQGEGKGIETLQNVAEKITGEPIHYYVKITLDAFIDTIDTIEGIDIEIPEYYKDAYPASELPPELQATCRPFYHDGKYCLFTFEKGVHHFDGQHALIYARSRLLSPRGDYDRARRQQQVIDAVKQKILSSETYLDPAKLWDIYNTMNKNIETNLLSLGDIRAALGLRDKINTDEIGQVVLDPFLGGINGKYIYVGDSNIGRGYHILVRDETFSEVQEFLGYVRRYPAIYSEASSVSILNATGSYNFEKDWAEALSEDNPLLVIHESNRVIPNGSGQFAGITIYQATDIRKPAAEKFLQEYFGVSKVERELADGVKALRGEDYMIVIAAE